MATWPSGKARVCKTLIIGSNPIVASTESLEREIFCYKNINSEDQGADMFYFLLDPVMSYNFILIAAAVIPAFWLMVKVYNSDRLEKETPYLMWSLIRAGIFSSLLALVEERILSYFLGMALPANSEAYNIILYFCIVAGAEESSKYIFMKRNTWNNPEFNCQYDGVVYAVFVSLGFALWENISYVINFGLTTAIARAVTAIPGHACFGVFMGIFYGISKKYANLGQQAKSMCFRVLGLVLPMLLHGAYDYIATLEQTQNAIYFIPFVAVLFIVSYILVNKASKMDRYI